MKNDLTVDSMLTEVKKNLSKYESLIKECESNASKKKISEAESSKKKIEQKIKLVKTIIKTEDDSFMLESYEDLKNELNKRLNIVSKKYEDKKEKKNDLFSSSNSHKKEKKSKKEKNDYDDDELNLNNNIKLSTDESSTSLDDDFARSEQKLNGSSAFENIPIIGKIFKGKCGIICCVAIIFLIGYYVIFYKKNNGENDNNS